MALVGVAPSASMRHLLPKLCGRSMRMCRMGMGLERAGGTVWGMEAELLRRQFTRMLLVTAVLWYHNCSA